MSLLKKAMNIQRPTQASDPSVADTQPNSPYLKNAVRRVVTQNSEEYQPVALDRVRLAVCVPCKDMMHSVFSYNLHSLLNYNWQKGIETKVFYNMGTLVCNQRESLLAGAREWDATHILWLDSDMSFPFYTAYKLLDHQVPIVAGNYVTRQLPYKTVAFREPGQWENYVKHNNDLAVSKDLIQVGAMGMGCMLTAMEVFNSTTGPWFEIKWTPETNDYLGEDINFCVKATGQGYKILVDDLLSRQLNHLGTFAFGHDLVK